MTPDRDTWKGAWSFVLLAHAFSWLFWIPLALQAHGAALPPGLAAFLASPLNPAAFGPLVASLVLSFIEGRWKGVLGLLKRGIDVRFAPIWLLPTLVLPLLVFAGGILLAVAVGAAALDTSVLSNPAMVVISLPIILLTSGPLQEEFGWRGYLQTRLQRCLSPLPAGLLVGVVWWLWHLPLAFIPGKFMASSLPLFVLLMPEIVLTAVVMTWIFNHTGGSVLPALLFHTLMNWSSWLLLPTMQANAGIIGFTVLLAAIVVGAVLAADRAAWRSRRGR